MKHRFGCVRDVRHYRDYRFRLSSPASLGEHPPFVDLRPILPGVFDQQDEGSCVGNAWATAGVAALGLSGELDMFIPARQGIYDQARILDGSFDYDAGTSISRGAEVLCKYGMWPENKPEEAANEPYPGTFDPKRPTAASLAYGARHQGLVRSRVDQSECMFKATLAQGVPIVFGWAVYEEDEDNVAATTGMMPALPKGRLLGWHAGVIFGYNETRSPQAALSDLRPIPPDRWGERNSWGPDFGDEGDLWFPVNRLLNSDLADDPWALQRTEIG